jgi:hypothetical protein
VPICHETPFSFFVTLKSPNPSELLKKACNVFLFASELFVMDAVCVDRVNHQISTLKTEFQVSFDLVILS